MVVKENQPTLLADLLRLFGDPALVTETATVAQMITGGHRRIERRTLWASPALVGYTDWPGLAQALCLEREVVRKQTGEVWRERAYAVTSLAPARADAATLLRLWRGHRTIENRLHWVRDVSFGEDGSPIRAGQAPALVAALRHTVIGVLRAHGHHAIAATRRRLAQRWSGRRVRCERTKLRSRGRGRWRSAPQSPAQLTTI